MQQRRVDETAEVILLGELQALEGEDRAAIDN